MKLETAGPGSCPTCPKCGNGNALLAEWNRDADPDLPAKDRRILICRDCGHRVDPRTVTEVIDHHTRKNIIEGYAYLS